MRAFALVALLVLASPVAAQAHGLAVPLNHSVRLPLAGPAQSVVVGSPSVIDVAVVDSRTVYVSGKTPGDTDVTVIDPLGRVVFRGDVSVAGGASVSVFRGAARTEAMCAPYCHDLPTDQAGGAAMAAAPTTISAALGAPPATAAGVMAGQAAATLPSAMSPLH